MEKLKQILILQQNINKNKVGFLVRINKSVKLRLKIQNITKYMNFYNYFS